MGTKKNNKKASPQIPAEEIEKDDDDGFTLVRSKHKPKQTEWKVEVKPADLEVPSVIAETRSTPKPKPSSAIPMRRAPLDPTQTNGSPYHHDFAHVRSPSDVLFQTSDGVLFWFSLSLLSHHSTRFALFDPETLWLPRHSTEFSSIINVAAVDSRTFAIVARTLLHDYAGVQKALHRENMVIGIMPSAITDTGVIGFLRQALDFAKTLGIQSFVSMISSLIATHAEGLLLLQIYLDYNTGSQMNQLLGL